MLHLINQNKSENFKRNTENKEPVDSKCIWLKAD